MWRWVAVAAAALVVGGAVVLGPSIMSGFDTQSDTQLVTGFEDSCRRSARQSLAGAGASGAVLDGAADAWCRCGVDVVRGMSRGDRMSLDTSPKRQKWLVEEMQRRCVPPRQ